MTSMLTRCPECGVTYAKDTVCPDCGYSDRGEAGVEQDRETVTAFAERLRVHRRNYAAYMVLMFATGLFGMFTSYLWLKVIFTGDVIAFVLIGVCTVLTGISTLLLIFSEKFLPKHLNCPQCEMSLDELGFEGTTCPGCTALLR